MTVPNALRQAGLAAFCILAATSPPASAADISRCDGSNGVSDTLESGYRDLGNGYVSYYQQSLDFFSEPDSVSGTVVVEACASGKVIYAPVYYCVDGAGGKCDKKTSYDFRTAAVTLLDKAAGAEPTTFDDLVTRLTKINPETSVEPVGEYGSESCACHVAYPRLRGDKQKFSFPKDWADRKSASAQTVSRQALVALEFAGR